MTSSHPYPSPGSGSRLVSFRPAGAIRHQRPEADRRALSVRTSLPPLHSPISLDNASERVAFGQVALRNESRAGERVEAPKTTAKGQ